MKQVGRGSIWGVLCVAVGLGAACGGSGGGGTATPSFSFVVIADPHLYGDADADARLVACVAWVEAHRAAESIQLVAVVGDVGREYARVREILDGLSVPWVPLVGDNTVNTGREATWDATFGPHLDGLSGVLGNWTRAPLPVANPETGTDAHLQNFAFDLGGLRFIGLDFCHRRGVAGESETADLHDFPGGTYPFLAAQVTAGANGKRERIVLLSHHPMHDFVGGYGAFTSAEMEVLEGLTAAHADHVYANLAGHYHVNWHENRAGYEVYLTDATWDDDNALRLVRVSDGGDRWVYEHSVVAVP